MNGRKGLFGLVFIVGILWSFVTAAGEEPPVSMRLTIDRLKEEIYAINLINLLDLSSAQIDVILRQSELARPMIMAYEESLPKVYARQLKAYREFKEEDEENQGFSTQVERNTLDAHFIEVRLRERLVRRLNELALPVDQVLTESQRAQVDGFSPQLFPQDIQETMEAHRSHWRIKSLRKILMEAAALSSARFQREEERLIQSIINTLPFAHGSPPRKRGKDGEALKKGKERVRRGEEDYQVLHDRIGSALGELRALPKDRLERELDAFIHTRILPSKVAQVEAKILEINRSKRPHLEKLARYLLNKDAAGYLKNLRKRAPKGP
jgi:hypothetical protein